MKHHKNIIVSLPNQLVKLAKEKSQNTGRTLSGFIRVSIEQYLTKIIQNEINNRP